MDSARNFESLALCRFVFIGLKGLVACMIALITKFEKPESVTNLSGPL